ncbi:DUF397 domain-containing protein [Streptomyces luteogriseus]|uniref:DUF397 domain-containing protein n=1 Tax=Streptomyces luteogriseus TaxID=68233 RepID=UPI002E33DD68|nr:DUF397 domain-containing protein [Streptomyces luteogriseus]WTJ30823.1 DUF397 domain-containing protein [Streptomyces luteogriseus]
MESNVLPTGIQWRKSSYSSDQGGNCVECAAIGMLAWRKSSYSSDQGGNCLELAETPHATIAIRDSKTPAGPTLTLDPAAFTSFINWTSTTAE